MFNDMKYLKSNCEKYTLNFNDGWDYAIFTIDDTGINSRNREVKTVK